MAIKATSTGTFNNSDVIASIYYAIYNGADIINMSLGGGGYSASFQAAINMAHNANISVVASAGNDGKNTAHYPSDYNNVISVISLDSDDRKSSFSNYGSKTDISAPGRDIYSTVTGGRYASMSGTSMAAPFVTGVIALMDQVNCNLKPDQIESIIKETAFDIGKKGWDSETAAGKINPLESVKRVIPKYKYYRP